MGVLPSGLVPFGSTGPLHPGADPVGPAMRGWSVGSYDSYEQAQRAVDHLAEHGFPVGEITIVGRDLRLVEQVLGRLTWGRVLGGGAASGAWFGLLVGGLLASFSPVGWGWIPVMWAVAGGGLFGAVAAGAEYAATAGRRDFCSAYQVAADRYELWCQPRSAQRARDLLGKLALATT